MEPPAAEIDAKGHEGTLRTREAACCTNFFNSGRCRSRAANSWGICFWADLKNNTFLHFTSFRRCWTPNKLGFDVEQGRSWPSTHL